MLNRCGASQEELNDDYSGSCVAVTFMRKIPPSSDASPTEVAGYLHEERIISKYATVQPAIQYNGGALSALNIRRIPTVHSLPLVDMRPPPYAVEPDEVFLKLYQDFMSGSANAYYSRLSEKDILAGYYRGDAAATPVMQDTPDEIVTQQCAKIRSG